MVSVLLQVRIVERRPVVVVRRRDEVDLVYFEVDELEGVADGLPDVNEIQLIVEMSVVDDGKTESVAMERLLVRFLGGL